MMMDGWINDDDDDGLIPVKWAYSRVPCTSVGLLDPRCESPPPVPSPPSFCFSEETGITTGADHSWAIVAG